MVVDVDRGSQDIIKVYFYFYFQIPYPNKFDYDQLNID